jgi:hypothetical protein
MHKIRTHAQLYREQIVYKGYPDNSLNLYKNTTSLVF